MTSLFVSRAVLFGLLATLAACSTVSRAPSQPPVATPEPGQVPPAPQPAPPVAAPTPPPPEMLKPTAAFESADFIVAFARAGDTPETLAARHLKDLGKGWMIRDFMNVSTFTDGQEVVIPKKEWNPTGVFPWGYQVVPILVYHNIGPETKGRLLISAKLFDEQMRYLKAEGYHALSLKEFLEYSAGKRQLAKKSVLIAFDDGYKSFIRYARPVLKELGYPATLFVYTDFLGGGSALSWQEIRTLAEEGFDIQAHSKSHGDLRRKASESDAQFSKRMEAELSVPLALFKKNLGHPSETIAYPYGAADDEVAQLTAQNGYRAAFTVRRQSNPSFVSLFKIGRSQVYSEMSLQEFAKNLTLLHDEPIGGAPGDGKAPSALATAVAASTTQTALAKRHIDRADGFETRGYLRQALDERRIAATIEPGDTANQQAVTRLEADIKRRATDLSEEARRLLERGSLAEGRRRFLNTLALDPQNRIAFEALQREVREITLITHTVRGGETLASIAELYYGDAIHAELIAETNQLTPNAKLTAGRTLRIPEIPGVSLLPR